MTLTSSYAIQLKSLDFNIMDTVKIYREAVAFCIDAFNKKWSGISLSYASLLNPSRQRDGLVFWLKFQKPSVEPLVHITHYCS
jgi:hypothetical protein